MMMTMNSFDCNLLLGLQLLMCTVNIREEEEIFCTNLSCYAVFV